MRSQLLCTAIAATASAMRPFAALPSHSRRRTAPRRAAKDNAAVAKGDNSAVAKRGGGAESTPEISDAFQRQKGRRKVGLVRRGPQIEIFKNGWEYFP